MTKLRVASESIPTGPETPESFCAINLTESSVISTGIKIGILLYISNVAQEGKFCAYAFTPRPMQQFS